MLAHVPSFVPVTATPSFDLEAPLAARFGLERFHPWQREAIEALLARGRALVVAPTGGGKSLCYQLPAVVLGGTSVVVSPLIALMDDQVRSLVARGVAATYLASTLPPAELAERERQLAAGRYQLVYVAPERLRSARLCALLQALAPPLVAIDEAHCISQWGHDFRPDYLRLGPVLEALRPERVLACTATATPAVRREILERLGLSAERTAVVLRGFARPNLHLAVRELERPADRRALAVATIRDVLGSQRAPAGAAIVYAGTRKACERLADELRDEGWEAAAYHAGLAAVERDRVSAAFAERRLAVVVATNAFGMGIDRPDIRCVVHTQAPGSIEQYYQEVGRAGRDGAPAHGLLLSGSSDYGFRRRLIESGGRNDGFDVERSESAAAQIERQWRLFLDLMRYVEAGSCRHDFILRYFGDEQEILGGCGHCDVCQALEASGSDSGVRAVSDEDALIVRKALAAVARVRRRAGLTALAASLHGTDDERVRRLGLTELSTHGILRDHETAWILSLLRRLITAGLVDVTAGDFPVPFLTELGAATMKGERPVCVLPPEPARERIKAPRERKRRRGERKPVDDRALDGPANERFQRLREARLAMARALGLPPYVVCHDRTLRELAVTQPATLADLATVYGMGPARIDAYGVQLLEALR